MLYVKDTAFCLSSVYIMYRILSILQELADGYPDGGYGAVPSGTMGAVLRFEEEHFHK